MGNNLKKYLKKFDAEKDKGLLGIELMVDLEIESEQLIDFAFLEEKYDTTLSVDDKFKLKNIYKSTVKLEGNEILKKGMTNEEKQRIKKFLDEEDREKRDLILRSIDSFESWVKGLLGK